MALLGKWMWCIRLEKHSLWGRVLSARYGELEIGSESRVKKASKWWQNIKNLEGLKWVEFELVAK